jgi:PAS domain S-box-containing protein
MKILIADDDQTTRRILLAILKKEGFEVVSCCDGTEALGALQADDAPMLAILDWMMPGMDGVDICRSLRASEAASQPYLILLTCKGYQEDVVSGLGSGADDYIVKPFSADELLARIKVGQRVLGLQSALAARVEELTKSGQNFAEAQAIAHLGSWEYDLEKDEEYRSDEFFRLLGLSPQEAGRANDSVFDYIHPDDRDRVLQKLTATLKHGMPYDVEYRITRADGVERIFHAQGKILKNGSGRNGTFVGSVLDITERRQAEIELQHGQQQLLQAEKMAALGFLLAGIAHEINNPNGLILLNFPVLMEAYRDAEPILDKQYREHGDFPFGGLPYSKMREEIPEMFEELLESARRIKRIVEDLKNFTRRDDASFEETLDLNELLRTSLRLMGTMLRDSTYNFSVQYADALPKIKGNGQRIEQVVVNLLMNACQALEDKSQRIAVQTSFDEQKGMVELFVKDEGVGIKPEHIIHLTSPFFTTKREKGGTGLGLSLSERIVTAHGGTLTFASEYGKGTTVRLALPVQKEM